MSITRQEMLDRAVRGLRSQNWERAYVPYAGGDDSNYGCVYLTADGRRCAWGWVDPTHTPGKRGTVRDLRARGVGLAAHLDDGDTIFACDLQGVHDDQSLESMEFRFRRFAEDNGLTFPEDA